MLALAALFCLSQIAAPAPLAEFASRLAEEADVFEQNIPKTITTETLQQRTLLPPSRFRPRIGAAATQPPRPRQRVREIVSEYSVGALKDSASHSLTEFRQVISDDGRKVQSPEAARHALSLGLTSPDDRVRKRMLEDFARNGLVDIASDYGLILLAFSKRGQRQMHLTPAGEENVGAEAAIALAWEQTSDAPGMISFIGNQAVRRAMRGRVLLRQSDSLPLRVEAFTEHTENGHVIREEASVDYVLSSHGFLTPASVAHRHLVDAQLITENLYRYEPFKLFSADAEIKFTELDPQPAAKK